MPVNVLHKKYQAANASVSQVQWYVDSPSMNVLLDSEAYVTYQVRFTNVTVPAPIGELGGQFEGSVSNVGNAPGDISPGDTGALLSVAPDNDLRYALRQGFCMNNAISRANLKLNESQDSVRPLAWNGELMRFYATEEEVDSICSMSGGPFDSGNFSNFISDDANYNSRPTDVAPVAPAVVVASVAPVYNQRVTKVAPNDATLNLRASFPLIGKWHNPGLNERWWRMAEIQRTQGAAPNAVLVINTTRYAEEFTVEITERVPIDPFLQWSRKDGQKTIPWVRRMELEYTFHPKARELILQGFDTLPSSINLDWYTTKPTLHLKWIVPPASSLPTAPVVLPYTYTDERILSTVNISMAATEMITPLATERIDGIRVNVHPSMIMLYYKASPDAADMFDCSEKHLEIANLKMSYNTAKGSTFDASSQQLFSMYVKNSPSSATRPYTYDQWKRRYCTVVLRPEDFGLQYEDQDGVFINLEIQYRGHWHHPTVGTRARVNEDADRNYQLHMLLFDKRGMLMQRDNSVIGHLKEFGI